MTTHQIILVVLIFALIANAVALLRYWRAMREFQNELRQLTALRTQMTETLERERQQP